MKFYVDLNKIDDIKTFVKNAERYDCDIVVRNSGRIFAIDGTSLMGMFSLNLSEPVEVEINDSEVAKLFKEDVYTMVV